MSVQLGKLADFYEEHLKTVLLPFWLKRGIDHEYGGVFTCFNNTGETLVSTDKYVWSQGRAVWIFSRLSTMDIFTDDERSQFLQYARATAEFLMKNCLLENGNCTFILTREGLPKPMNPGKPCDIGIGADWFVVLGLSRYARVTGDEKAFSFAKSLYDSIQERQRTGNFRSYPYPEPEGFKGPPMTSLLLAHELSMTIEHFNDAGSAELSSFADSCIEKILYTFVDENLIPHEKIRTDNTFDHETLMGRYVNPGHTIEDMWFVIHQAMRKNNRKAVERAAAIVKKAFEIGWDREFGGLQLFADQDGGAPKGSIEGFEDEVMVHKVINDWGNKLWWPHSEALYTTLLAHKLTGDKYFIELYEKVHEYTFRTFPNPNRETGEWIQIRDRRGNPESKVVALPVKDPFHIIRNFILVIDLLRKPELVY